MILLVALLGCSDRSVDPPAEVHPRMWREQVFFASDARPATLVVLVLQRELLPSGAGALELKGFGSWQGTWQAPFWERLTLDRWSGDALDGGLGAWESRQVRVGWDDQETSFSGSFQTKSRALAVAAPDLVDAGVGQDPHGTVQWRSGPGQLTVDGVAQPGTVLVERATGALEPRPWFGDFEMWVVAPPDGGLELARVHLDDPSATPDLVAVRGTSVARRTPRIAAEIGEDGSPGAWTVDGVRFARIEGTSSRGVAPDGGPAEYAVSLARGDGRDALVFHLRDAGRPGRTGSP